MLEELSSWKGTSNYSYIYMQRDVTNHISDWNQICCNTQVQPLHCPVFKYNHTVPTTTRMKIEVENDKESHKTIQKIRLTSNHHSRKGTKLH